MTSIHPAAWWAWALLLSGSAMLTLNPLVNLTILGVVITVVYLRRSDAPWALAFRLYLLLGLTLFLLRIFWRLFFAGPYSGTTVLIPLAGVQLFGLSILGPITLENLAAGAIDGLRLATIVITVGAANTLADPKRLLHSLPKALQEIGTAVTIALSVFPSLATSTVRIARARTYRSAAKPTLPRMFREVAVPVLQDALDSSLTLAASMAVRGYESRPRHRAVQWLLIACSALLVASLYFLLSPDTRSIGAISIAVTVLGLVATLRLGGIAIKTTRYRPDRWSALDAAVVISAIPCFICAAFLPYGLEYATVVQVLAASAALAALVAPKVAIR